MSPPKVCTGTEQHPGCGEVKRLNARGLCPSCYNKAAAKGWKEPAPRKPRKGVQYEVPCLACNESNPHYGKGLCRRCYRVGYEGPSRRCKSCCVDGPHFALGLCRRCYMASKATQYNTNRRKAREAFSPEEAENLRAAQRSYRRVRLYGLTEAQFSSLLEAAGHCCEICELPVKEGRGSDLKSRANVDHCHTNGHVRGVLCTRCNTAIGSLGDSPERAHRAAVYLQRTAR